MDGRKLGFICGDGDGLWVELGGWKFLKWILLGERGIWCLVLGELVCEMIGIFGVGFFFFFFGKIWGLNFDG